MLDGKMSPMDQAMAEIEGKETGEERGKIVGGVPAARGAYPFQVALFTTANGKDGMMCGGSLINMKWVLTAAHCITKAAENDAPYPATMVNVFAGGLSFGEGDRVRAARVIVHPRYTSRGVMANDIALIELERPVNESSGAKPITLASGASDNPPGTPVKLLGWGKTTEGGASSKTLLELNISMVDRKVCNQSIVEYRAIKSIEAFRVAQKHLALQQRHAEDTAGHRDGGRAAGRDRPDDLRRRNGRRQGCLPGRQRRAAVRDGAGPLRAGRAGELGRRLRAAEAADRLHARRDAHGLDQGEREVAFALLWKRLRRVLTGRAALL